jgi:hypothetical protein
MSPAITTAMISASTSGEVNLATAFFRTLSGIQVWDLLAFEPGNLVFEQKFALLEALHLQLVDVHVHRQARDDLIEVTMLDAQLTQLFDVAKQLAIDVVLDFDHREKMSAERGGGRRSLYDYAS